MKVRSYLGRLDIWAQDTFGLDATFDEINGRLYLYKVIKQGRRKRRKRLATVKVDMDDYISVAMFDYLVGAEGKLSEAAERCAQDFFNRLERKVRVALSKKCKEVI